MRQTRFDRLPLLLAVVILIIPLIVACTGEPEPAALPESNAPAEETVPEAPAEEETGEEPTEAPAEAETGEEDSTQGRSASDPARLSPPHIPDPLPPASQWSSFTYEAGGLTFEYPANWHIWVKTDDHVVVMNVPPGSIHGHYEVGADYMRVDISLYPASIGDHDSLEAYVEARVHESLPPENIISIEPLPALPQGYDAVRARVLALGENMVLYVANENKVVTLGTSYGPGKKDEKTYLAIMDQIAGTITLR